MQPAWEVMMNAYEVKGQFQARVTFRVHNEYAWVKGWDMRLEVKIQVKVKHAQELTFDLIHTHCDLTAWLHILKLISSCFDIHWRSETAFLLGSQK